MSDKTHILSRSELEELCVKQNIVIERNDPFTNSKLYIPNLEKINKMIREFDFLVDGASRGKAVNEISRIERYLYEHENDPEEKNRFLASSYSDASMYIDGNRSLLEDKSSENWKYLFVNYFKIEDIYRYFNKDTSASVFFRDFPIYKDMVSITYYVKLMDYLRSQVELQTPVEDDKDNPSRLEEFNLKLVIFHELGIIDQLKEKIPQNTLPNLARFLTAMCDEPGNWRDNMKKIKNLNMDNDNDPLTELNLNKARELISVFGIEMEKE